MLSADSNNLSIPAANPHVTKVLSNRYFFGNFQIVCVLALYIAIEVFEVIISGGSELKLVLVFEKRSLAVLAECLHSLKGSFAVKTFDLKLKGCPSKDCRFVFISWQCCQISFLYSDFRLYIFRLLRLPFSESHAACSSSCFSQEVSSVVDDLTFCLNRYFPEMVFRMSSAPCMRWVSGAWKKIFK
jgi:hypothetical protein